MLNSHWQVTPAALEERTRSNIEFNINMSVPCVLSKLEMLQVLSKLLVKRKKVVNCFNLLPTSQPHTAQHTHTHTTSAD